MAEVPLPSGPALERHLSLLKPITFVNLFLAPSEPNTRDQGQKLGKRGSFVEIDPCVGVGKQESVEESTCDREHCARGANNELPVTGEEYAYW